MTDPSRRQPGDSSGEAFARLQRDLAQPRVPSVEEQIKQLDEELEVLVTDKAAAAMPAVRDGLVLQECAPEINVYQVFDRCQVFGKEGGPVIASYVWYLEEHFEQALSWVRAHEAVQRDYAGSQNFFLAAVVDLFHFDRAVRAAKTHGLGDPVRFKQLPQRINRDGLYYELARKSFDWSSDIPPRVTNAVARFAMTTAADVLWIGTYEIGPANKNDPILYAEFGSSWVSSLNEDAWEVEVVRWD